MAKADTPTTPAAVTAETLLTRIASTHDRAAYAALFTHFAPKIKAFVMAQGLSAQAAEDLAQDTLLSVWRKAHLFDSSRASAATWIYTIARNLRIDMARKAKRVRDLPEDLWQPEPEKPFDQGLIQDEDTRSVKALLSDLPEEQLAIVKLSFYEELSHGDIARALSLPLGTVKSRLRLAMARLRGGMSRGEGTGGAA